MGPAMSETGGTPPPGAPGAGAGRSRGPFVLGALLVVAGLLVLGLVLLRDRSDGSDGGGDRAPASAFDAAAVTTAPTTPEGIGGGWAPAVRGRSVLRGFGQVAGVVTSKSGETCPVCLLAALDGDQHARGLMEVTDPSLGGHDGMVFVFADDQRGNFWMRDTPMALSIAYLDAHGTFVSAADMAPCADSPSCPGYPPGGPFRYALEVPEGRLADILMAAGSTLELRAGPCPLAAAGE
jgi:uncharacterized membrane protein (UPF0127 family)